MRKMAATTLCFMASLPLLLGSLAYADPPANPPISFSFPFGCDTHDGKKIRCLTNIFKPGLNAVLIGKTGICGAKTSAAFLFDKYPDFRATRLTGADDCFTVKDDEEIFRSFRIAVVGADPAAVRLVSLQEGGTPIPKDIEVNARKLATPHIEEPQKVSDGSRVPVGLSDTPPKVLRSQNVTLLIFELQADGEPWEPGPTVALINEKLSLLEGACTYGEPMFFSVNGKLYLTYRATVACCGCGDSNTFVYDLSNGTPKKVYQDSSFAN